LRNGEIYNCMKFSLPPTLIDLYQYLVANDKIADIYEYNEQNLQIETDKVLQMIKEDQQGWENYVPDEVARIIKERSLFGFAKKAVS